MSISQTKPIIVNKVTASNLKAVVRNYSFWMVTKDGAWTIHFNRGWKRLTITDTSKFFKNGETKSYVSNGSFTYENTHIDCLYKIIECLEGGAEFNHEFLEKYTERVELLKNKSLGAFNPYSISHIKPFVFKGHNKIRRDDIVKILVNQQYERVQIDSKYTDDYLYDAENDFFRNIELQPMEFLKNYLDLYDPTISIDEKGEKVSIYYGSSTYSITLK